MTATDKRREMMLAQRRDADVFHDHHLVVLVARQRNHVLRRILTHAGGQLRIHLSDALRRFLQSRTLRILANAFENQAHTLLNLFQIYFFHPCYPWRIFESATRAASSTI